MSNVQDIYQCGTAMTFASQSFYVYRITVLGGSKIAGVIITILALAQICGSIWVGVHLFRVKLFSRVVGRGARIIVAICNGSGVLCDIMIAFLMTRLLIRSMRISKGQTRRHIRKLVRLLIETGSMTAFFTALNITLAEGAKNNYYQVTSTVLSKMYANTLVVVLNSRMELGPGQDLDGRGRALQFLVLVWMANVVAEVST
ncbi:hypothetical protein GALMADRAFT_215079 [Galerina marginata CBS 339.88]|uniref:DUF6534 domain-containing protein n=1 Tax=Galerina marginata (strain CBS 339.88) TaxID=685588 RepID=A0A067SEQ1_GALM3|nr:hypothetical protein GALMADRAFT_215079 [Galerina marginata CBS 339.88]